RAGSATTSSAPRTRGWSYPADRTMLVFHVGPAHAGMVHASFGWHDKKTSRPRARGDGPSASRPWWSLPGSAPRARGWSRRRFGGVARAPVGPAHAGMVLRFDIVGRSVQKQLHRPVHQADLQHPDPFRACAPRRLKRL